MANVTVAVKSRKESKTDTVTTTSTTETKKTSAKPSATLVYGKEFAKADRTIPFRLVGSYEYLNAVQNFDELVAISTNDEIKVYDSIIATQQELSFYSGIATDYGLVPISDIPEGDQQLVELAYRRQSLAWLHALARVELGATISMYGSSEAPFDVIGGSNFGQNEFQEIILDDLTFHLKSVQNDQGFQDAMFSTKPNSDTLAYLRRAKLINDLLDKVMLSNNRELIAAAEPYAKGVHNYIAAVSKRIHRALRPDWSLTIYGESTSTSTSTSTSSESSTETRSTERSSKSIRFIDRSNLQSCQLALEAQNPGGF